MENEKIENPFKGMQMPSSFKAKLADWKKPKVTDLRIGRERDFILEYTETMTLKRNVNVDNGAVTETFTFKREGIRKFKHDAFLQHWIEQKQEEARRKLLCYCFVYFCLVSISDTSSSSCKSRFRTS